MTIVWDDAWNIGHVEIDEQHKQWVGFYNNLDEAFRSEDAQDLSKAQERTLNEMVDYTLYHFTTEEDLMRETKFPDAANHWRLHKNFKNVLFELSRNRLEGKTVLNYELLSLTRNWLLHHIQTEDQRLGKFMRSRCQV